MADIEFVDLISSDECTDVEEMTDESSKMRTTRQNSEDDSESTEVDENSNPAKDGMSVTQNGDKEHSTPTDEDLDKSFSEPPIVKKKSKISAVFGGAVEIGNKVTLNGVQFNQYLPDGHNYLAAVGGDRLTIYECPPNGPSFRLVDCFADCNIYDGKSKRENYYSVCWSYDSESGNALVICGGVLATIRVIDCVTKQFRHLCGHSASINDLKVSPHDHNLLLSSSEDYTLRLWNLKTSVCVVKFGGESGHRSQVICADFYTIADNYFVSCGMDHSIKIWSLDVKDIREAIKESYGQQEDETNFPMRFVYYPVFSTRNIHRNYIDCVQFSGRLLVSKSVDNEIVVTRVSLLEPKPSFVGQRADKEVENLGTFEMIDNEYWFVKFSMNLDQTLLSIGNNKGITYLWDMDVENPFEYEPFLCKHRKSRSSIRQTCFNADGTILVGVNDKGVVWRWNLTKQ